MPAPRFLSARVEAGIDAPWARALSNVYGAVAAKALARPLALAAGTRAVTVGGATLGGSGATPVAIACARVLAAEGAAVAFVGHGYGAAVERARWAHDADDPRLVGDEAIVAARALASAEVLVAVGPSRREAAALAAGRAAVLVVDGAVQLAPRAALALLVVDAERPWGAGAPPPAGDLRAPSRALLAAADAVVRVRDEAAPTAGASAPELALELTSELGGARPVYEALATSPGVRIAGELVPWSSVARLRTGLLTALARPDRVLRFLARRGVVPRVHHAAPDHGPGRRVAVPSAAEAGVDLWLASEKCALTYRPPEPHELPRSAAAAAAGPRRRDLVGILAYTVEAPRELRNLVASVAHPLAR